MVVQTALQRFSFDKYLLCRVEYTLRYHDPCKLGLVDRLSEVPSRELSFPSLGKSSISSWTSTNPPYNLHSLFVSTMTVPIRIIHSLSCSFDSADECGRVNYCCFMQYLDWVENAAPKALPSHERVSKK
jgi:hypothetical protein